MYEIDSMSRLAKYFKLKTLSIINEKFQDPDLPDHFDAELGCDLTTFKPGAFQKFLNELGLNPTDWKYRGDSFEWWGDDLVVVTKNNPITGEYAGGKRDPEKDYASFMGFSGVKDEINLVKKLLKKYTADIKEISKKHGIPVSEVEKIVLNEIKRIFI